MLILGIALSVLVGVSLGLLGGGGSILTVPILVYVLKLPAHEAIAMSLLVVGTTSLAALVPHARAGRVRWRTGLIFGAAGMVGAYGAGRVAKFIPPAVLLLLFGGMMLVTAVAMLRGRKPAKAGAVVVERKELSAAKVIAEGLVVGAITGLVGAGGGFLVVPALLLLGGLSMEIAVGTSLVVIAMKSFAGFAGYLGSTPVDWRLAAMVTVAAVLGSFVGGRLAGRVSPDKLREGFAVFVVAMAVFILGQQVPETFGAPKGLLLPYALVGAIVTMIVGLAIPAMRRAAAARRTAVNLHEGKALEPIASGEIR